jgi:hypothetical protein
MNRHDRADNTSGYRGAAFNKASGKWVAQIGSSGRRMHLGVFVTATEAAAVYNFAAKRLHGEFAVLNDLSQVEVL